MSPYYSLPKGGIFVNCKLSRLLLLTLPLIILTACMDLPAQLENNSNTTPSKISPMPQSTISFPQGTVEAMPAPDIKLNYTTVEQAIQQKRIFTEKEIGLEGSMRLIGVFQNGKILCISDGDFIYRYKADNNEYKIAETVPLTSPTKMTGAGISDDGAVISDLDILPYDSNSNFAPKMINSNNSIAYMQVDSQDRLSHKIYRIDLQTKKVSEINTDEITNVLLTDEQKQQATWVTPIALADQNTLYHVFVQGTHVGKMTSYWAVLNKQDNVLFFFQTKYFDNLTNVHTNSEGRFVAFTYSQTPGYPQLLDIENKKVYPLLNNDSELFNHAVSFLSWVDTNKLCIGFVNEEKPIVIISIDDVIVNK